MGFGVFAVVLEPEMPLYVTGQSVQGYLSVATQQIVDCRGIKVRVKGKAKVKFSKGSGKNRRTYRSEEKYFRHEVVVWSGAEVDNKFHPGSSKFPFHFILPRNVPSSFSSPNGDVIYKVEAEADIPFAFDQTDSKLFSVNYMYDLNLDPNASNPLYVEKEKTVCCCCCAMGPINLSMRAARSGYVPGENIVVDGEVVNHSSSTLEYTEIKLEQLITYIAGSHTKRVQRTVQRVYHPQLAGGSRDVWAAVNLPIPPIPPSHLLHCNLITIDYAFAVVGKVGTCLSAKALTPVIIGSLPLRGTYATFRPSTPIHFGGTTVTVPRTHSGRSIPTEFNPSGPLPSLPSASPSRSPSAPPAAPLPTATASAPQVPAHLPYSDPPPPYTASLLPDEYHEIPPPSYAACAFGTVGQGSGGSGYARVGGARGGGVRGGGARGGGARSGGGSDESEDDEGGFAPHYLTYRTNT